MPILGSLGCCARAANDHATADPTIPAMKSRRRIASSKAQDCVNPVALVDAITAGILAAGNWASMVVFAKQQLVEPNVRCGSKAEMLITSQ